MSLLLFFRPPSPVQAEWKKEINKFSRTLAPQFQTLIIRHFLECALVCPIAGTHKQSHSWNLHQFLLCCDVLFSKQVLNLEEVESTMTMQYNLLLEWRDTRVTFRNLRHETFLNTMGKEDALKVWYPKVLFYNTEGMEETKVRKNQITSAKQITTDKYSV